MTFNAYLKLSVMAGAVGLMTSSAAAQTAAQPADGALPEVEVIQKKKAAAAAKKKAAPAQAASPAPVAPSEADFVEAAPAGTRGADGRMPDNAPNMNPINASSGILPQDLQNYTGAGTRVTTTEIDQQRPLENHELLSRVPGVSVTYDDGLARHSNISVRGSPARRSRKVLVMEDGVPINFSTYLDPSTHYTPPTDRIESVEVMRGAVLAYGPLTNHGVINFRNLNPFGEDETVISAAIGYTEGSNMDVNNYRHVHTRQNLGNVGIVASYSGANGAGSWDVEELSYNDFYGAIGFRGTDQDLTISGGYFRQRDVYDEANFEGGNDAQFFANGHNKTRGALAGFFESETGYNLSSYNADVYRLQLAHNYYIDPDTTLSTRLYTYDQHRARFYPEYDVGDPIFMEGRDRYYNTYGADSRIEFANRSLFGLRQDIQAGVRYERQTFDNLNREGADGQILDFDSKGAIVSRTDLEADVFSAFVQTAIHLTPTLTVTPGLRFESVDISAQEIVDGDGSATSNHELFLPGISFAWEAMRRTTVYGGYHRGYTPHVTRDVALENFPIEEEVGDNFEIGLRSTAVRGFTFDLAYFHSRIENYQIKEAFTDINGLNIYGTMDEVEIDGFEIGARLESRPFTGGPWNFFGEAIYTYARSIIESGLDARDDGDPLEDVSGNRLPEVPEHTANLTLGFAHVSGFDASATATYHGDFFVDTFNTVSSDEAGLGIVDDVWLLSARANYLIPNTGATLFVSGHNLTDEFYIADRSDGAKPGLGRTIMGGVKIKFD